MLLGSLLPFLLQFIGLLFFVFYSIFRAGNLFQSLLLRSTSYLKFSAYSNADYAGDYMNRNSSTGFYIFLGDSLIFGKSKKQRVVPQASIEAKYHVMASITIVIVWLGWLLTNFSSSFHSYVL